MRGGGAVLGSGGGFRGGGAGVGGGYRGGRYSGGGNWQGGGYHRHRHGGFYPGFVAGAAIGSAFASPYYYGYPYYYDDDYYDEGPAVQVVPGGGDSVAYCRQRFKSYDVRSGTYLGYDGQRHPCP